MYAIRARFGPNSYDEDVWATAEIYDRLCLEKKSCLDKRRAFLNFAQTKFGTQYMHVVINQVKEIAWKLYLDDVSILTSEDHIRYIKKNLAILGFKVY